jgi:hypothetical protein
MSPVRGLRRVALFLLAWLAAGGSTAARGKIWLVRDLVDQERDFHFRLI